MLLPLKDWMRSERGKMSAQLQIDEMPGYLIERFIGSGATEEVERQFEWLAEKCNSTRKNKLLLDFTEVPADISLVDRYELGRRTSGLRAIQV
jgi:hypothetical protein